jgi:hypothetical protein
MAVTAPVDAIALDDEVVDRLLEEPEVGLAFEAARMAAR